jgi:NAD(P)-dependent dehydrogenase (short-subunit alcohol dehydrogenase family)
MTQLAGSMAGRTVLVTGATDGIGKAPAMGLAATGAHVAITGRDHGRTEAARRLRAASNGQVDTFVADMSDQTQVRRLADEILQRVTLSSRQGVYRGSRPAAATRAGMVIRGLSVRKQGG